MVHLSELLIDFVSSIQKFVNNTIQTCSIAFLIFCF